jgi:hypothetical protein
MIEILTNLKKEVQCEYEKSEVIFILVYCKYVHILNSSI